MTTTIDYLFSAALLVVGLVVAALAMREHRRMQKLMDSGQSELSPQEYRFGIVINVVSQWSTSAVLMVIWLFTTFRAESVYLVPGWAGGEWITIAVGIAVAAFMVGQTIVLRNRKEILEKLGGQLGLVVLMAPRNRQEQRYWDGLSVTAGVCEELYYRGFVLGVLATIGGLWIAIIGSTILFAMGHAYQGLHGALRVSAFGVVAAFLTVFSGSIYLAVFVHIVVDLSQGRFIAMVARAFKSSQLNEPSSPIAVS